VLKKKNSVAIASAAFAGSGNKGENHFLTNSEEETERFASDFARSLREGDIVLLKGELGAGKTCFVRGLVGALHGNRGEAVKSPSYTLLNIYTGAPVVYHFDFYRIENPEDIIALGLDEFFGKGICVAEWPAGFLDEAADRTITVTIKTVNENKRLIEVRYG